MNILTATGNLGRDAEVKQLGGSTVCNFAVAMTAGYGDNKQTVWLDCALWGKAAEGALPQYLVKGQQVAVSGELSTFEATNGKTYLKLRCNTVDLIGKRDDSLPVNPQPQAQPQPQPQAQPPHGYRPPSPQNVAYQQPQDDVPF